MLLRIEHERLNGPQLQALPPDALLTLSEIVEPLLHNGWASLLYKKRQIRMQLTTCCQLCGFRCGTGELMTAHLQAEHPVHLQDTLHLKELLQWCLFMQYGCYCNPSSGWGSAHHECAGLTQLAILVHELQMPILLP